MAPLGDPIEIKIRGYHLSLRKEEAEGIEVEII
ncbi:MAG TPA: FeoA family protein [Syntrophorhabdaceae bacterium]|nr:FeoA family protein [Syntrophorhabdaceae bacterium]